MGDVHLLNAGRQVCRHTRHHRFAEQECANLLAQILNCKLVVREILVEFLLAARIVNHLLNAIVDIIRADVDIFPGRFLFHQHVVHAAARAPALAALSSLPCPGQYSGPSPVGAGDRGAGSPDARIVTAE